ncbi:MAG: hypothetical protein JXB39_00185 [Deltaproteobacteria bacterium]|nr:hypothetical protein [Deltaproteobacteria bacterium]
MTWAAVFSAMPEVARRAGRHTLAHLIRRLDDLSHERPDLPPVRVLAALVPVLTGEVTVAEREAAALCESLETARATGQIRPALADALARTASGAALLGDLKALDRALGPEAVTDRLLLAVHEVRQAWEFLALALASQGTDALPEDDRVAVRDAAATLLDGSGPWPVRVAAARLMGSASACEAAGAASARQRLLDLAWDARQDPWVQVACLEAWLGLQPAGPDMDAVLLGIGAPNTAIGLTLPPDHLFVRARVAALAARYHRWEVLRALHEEPDPSEHVRIEVARALAGSPRWEDVAALVAWLALPGDRVPRAAAAVCCMPPSGPQDGRWIALGAAALSSDAWVAEIVIRALLDRRRLVGPDEAARVAAEWGDALARWRTQKGDLGITASALLHWCDVQADPVRRDALGAIEDWLDTSGAGEVRHFQDGPVARLDEDALLDVLALAAFDGFDLSADATDRSITGGTRGWLVYHGERAGFQPWRLLYEATHLHNDKRQAFSHVTDRVPPGRLVAPSSRLAEATPTRVPGQRTASPTRLDWRSDLPLPSMLLRAAARGGIRLRTPRVDLSIHPAVPPWRAWIAIQLGYRRLADQRARLIASEDPDAVAIWDHLVQETGFVVERRALGPVLGFGLADLDDVVAHLAALDSNTVAQLAAFSAGLAVYWIGRSIVRTRKIRRNRSALPLVIGGWGSRGKSGTERLKAALFHGLGYSVMCKTTGCEAMVVTSVPGRDPTEVFLYRPDGKATIHEQADVISFAAATGVQVFLWECMALNPDYVEILQKHWTCDDFTTLTNAYPDHEDIQGPAGRDVAEVISAFLPRRGRAFTTEQHMAPILEAEARRQGTTLTVLRPETWKLLPCDVLGRIPYDEHPRNVAMVVRLAEELGIAPDVALKCVADHVVPDLGVLKEYGPMHYEERRASFVNGMSANERAGFLSNWARSGFDARHPGAGLTDWIAVVANNRADRLARQAVFARVAALDVVADSIVIIGTNVAPFRDQQAQALRVALAEHLRDVAGSGPDARARLVREIARRTRRDPLSLEEAKERLGSLLGRDLPEDAQAFWSGSAEAAALSLVVHPVEPDRGLDACVAQWLREVSWLHLLASTDDWSIETAIAALGRLLSSRVVPLLDPSLTGDQVMHRVVTTAPAGCHVRAMGIENIKGTGLDFVYRWLSVQKVLDAIARFEGADRAEALEILRSLAARPDLGVADTAQAVEAVEGWLATGRLAALGLEGEGRSTLDGLAALLAERRLAMRTSRGTGRWAVFWRWLARTFEFLESLRSRREADKLRADLVSRRIGRSDAARVAKALAARHG